MGAVDRQSMDGGWVRPKVVASFVGTASVSERRFPLADACGSDRGMPQLCDADRRRI